MFCEIFFLQITRWLITEVDGFDIKSMLNCVFLLQFFVCLAYFRLSSVKILVVLFADRSTTTIAVAKNRTKVSVPSDSVNHMFFQRPTKLPAEKKVEEGGSSHVFSM